MPESGNDAYPQFLTKRLPVMEKVGQGFVGDPQLALLRFWQEKDRYTVEVILAQSYFFSFLFMYCWIEMKEIYSHGLWTNSSKFQAVN